MARPLYAWVWSVSVVGLGALIQILDMAGRL